MIATWAMMELLKDKILIIVIIMADIKGMFSSSLKKATHTIGLSITEQCKYQVLILKFISLYEHKHYYTSISLYILVSSNFLPYFEDLIH